VGGSADLLVVAHNRDELIHAIYLAQENNVRWRIFGSLTNILLPDSGLRGVVILNHMREVRFIKQTYRIYAESGAIVVQVAREAVRRGWGGLTWAVGLPGTIGGAVVNNAGAFGSEISKTLVISEIFNANGEVQEVGPEWFEFRYRYSKLKGPNQDEVGKNLPAHRGLLVLSATFQLRPRDVAHLQTKASEYTQRRRRTQPPGKTLGSTFQNPPGDYAGRLIEAAGLKGTRLGGFVISDLHANFFVNQGAGTAADYKALIRLAQREVEQQFGVRLETEIEIMPEEAAFVR
jgi:UDP-N-acetylmuramate dehydrogenase